MTTAITSRNGSRTLLAGDLLRKTSEVMLFYSIHFTASESPGARVTDNHLPENVVSTEVAIPQTDMARDQCCA
jgi:hypothetical protein